MSTRWEMLNEEGARFYRQGNFQAALQYFEEALEEARIAFGTTHPNYAIALNNLAALSIETGEYGETEPLLRQTLEITGQVLGTDHPNYALNLTNLAFVYYSRNEYRKAEPLLRQALDIRERVLGKEHPDYARSLNNLAMVYNAMGRYDQVEPLLRQSLDIHEQIVGRDHPDYAKTLSNLAALYRGTGKYHKAEPLYHQTLDILRRRVGQEHPDYLTSLKGLAYLYERMGEYSKAEPLYDQTLQIRARVLGTDHPAYAESLAGMAQLFQKMGAYDKAEPLYHQALDIIEHVVGQEHHDYAHSLEGLAALYMDMGKFDRAEPLYHKVVGIEEKVKGREHPDYAASLINQTILYKNMGKYDQVEALYQEALDIIKKTLGEETPDYAQSLNNLGLFYDSMGEYGKAEPLLRRALEIKERVLGQEHPAYASTLNNLALLYDTTGEYTRAESLYRQALEIRGRALGEEHPDYAQSLHNLAALYKEIGRYDEAASLYRQSLDIKKRILGEKHFEYATGLHNLAILYTEKGEYSHAEKLFREASNIRRNALGDQHPEYAKSLGGLGWFYYRRGEHDQAASLNCQSLEIMEHNFGKEHPLYTTVLFNSACTEISGGRDQEALDKLLAIAENDNRMITRIASVSDEQWLQQYIRTFQVHYFVLLSHFVRHYSALHEYTPSILNIVLRRKAISLELEAMKRDAILASRNPQFKDRFDLLRQKRLTYGRLTLEGPGKTPPEQYQKRIHVLEQEILTLEKELSFHIPQLELEKKLSMVEHQTIAQLLPEGSTLLEFVYYEPFDLETKRRLPARYLAFFLSKDAEEDIQVLDLGKAAEIDMLITQYRDDITEEGDRNIAVVAPQKETPKAQDLSRGKRLYETLFQPLVEKIGDTKKLIIASDGNITLLPFEVLPQPNGRYVIEDFEIHYVDSGRDLLRFEYREESQSAPLIIADPNFNYPLDHPPVAIPPMTVKRFYELHSTEPVKIPTDLRTFIEDVVEIPIKRLKATGTEGEEIAKSLQSNANIWMQDDVLEHRIKQIQGPQILHFATHGLFLSHQQEEESELSRTLRNVVTVGNKLSRRSKYENPLLRSWLVLSGVNTFFMSQDPGKEAEDGILTALDVTGMDLIGTDLVVLSACMSGLGDMPPGEGVYGLRRAFTLAGARTLILSLWSVPDKPTKELMVNFYTKILQGTEKANALREAQREMITARREAKQSDSPYYWGAFVCVGDPGKLNEKFPSPPESLNRKQVTDKDTHELAKDIVTEKESELQPRVEDKDKQKLIRDTVTEKKAEPQPQKIWWKDWWKKLFGKRKKEQTKPVTDEIIKTEESKPIPSLAPEATNILFEKALKATNELFDETILEIPKISPEKIYEAYHDLKKSWGSLQLIQGKENEIRTVVLRNLQRLGNREDFEDYEVNLYPDQYCAQVSVSYHHTFLGVRLWRSEDHFYACGDVGFDTPQKPLIQIHLFQKGDYAFKQRNWQVAIDYLTKAISANVEPAGEEFVPFFRGKVLDGLGTCYKNLGQYEMAIHYWERSLSEGNWSEDIKKSIRAEIDIYREMI